MMIALVALTALLLGCSVLIVIQLAVLLSGVGDIKAYMTTQENL